MPYLEHSIILCDTNNIKKDSSFNIAEFLIEIGKYFKKRSRNIEIVISGILPRDECWSVNIIMISEINDIWAGNCSLHGSILLIKSMAGAGKKEYVTLICILKIMSS